MKTVLPILLLASWVVGCDVWDPRPGLQDLMWKVTDDTHRDPTAGLRQKEYRTWPKPIRQAVDSRLVLVGMTKNQVQVAMHIEEKNIQKTVTASTSETVESWVVWRLLNSWSYVKRMQSQMVTITFRNGVVTLVETVAER